MRTVPIPLLLLLFACPVGARSPAPSVPQPVVLDWTDQFRLNALPNNATPSDLEAVEDAGDVDRQRGYPIPPSSRATAAVTPDKRTKARTTYRRFVGERSSLNMETPVKAGPVSVGASYGSYRAMPTTREVEAHDVRVSLGIDF